jgi:hypothetical protein
VNSIAVGRNSLEYTIQAGYFDSPGSIAGAELAVYRSYVSFYRILRRVPEPCRAIVTDLPAYHKNLRSDRLNPAYINAECRRHGPPPLTRPAAGTMRLIAAGHTNAKVTRQLGITEGTVRSQLEDMQPVAATGTAGPDRSSRASLRQRRPPSCPRPARPRTAPRIPDGTRCETSSEAAQAVTATVPAVVSAVG